MCTPPPKKKQTMTSAVQGCQSGTHSFCSMYIKEAYYFMNWIRQLITITVQAPILSDKFYIVAGTGALHESIFLTGLPLPPQKKKRKKEKHKLSNNGLGY